jgi:8-oxo-dGTP pyrophosphatase MutT (NUDIX family)
VSDDSRSEDAQRTAGEVLASVRALRASPGSSPAPPAAAATVVLVRPGPDGLEVLLTRRPATMAFAAGVHVFPGGRVDAGDARPGNPLAAGLDADAAALRLAGSLPPDAALAHHVAAVRETFEETGIRIAAADLVPLSRWVTPAALARRFDVWFFAAPVPAGTEVGGPSDEVAAARWITPSGGLAAARAGELALLQPTLVTLEQLAGLPNLGAIAAAFRPGAAVDDPSVGPNSGGVSIVEQRWAGGIPGRRATGWLVGERDLVLVDPADPTAVTSDVVDAAIAARGGRLVGIALTGLRPEQHAGVELYAAGGGLPVVAGAGAAATAPYPVRELLPGEAIPFGDMPMVGAAPERVEPGALAYRLPDMRRLPPAAFAETLPRSDPGAPPGGAGASPGDPGAPPRDLAG